MHDHKPPRRQWRRYALVTGLIAATCAVLVASHYIRLPALNDPNFACYDLSGKLNQACVDNQRGE